MPFNLTYVISNSEAKVSHKYSLNSPVFSEVFTDISYIWCFHHHPVTNRVQTVRLHVSVSLPRVPAVSKAEASVAMVTFGISHISINVTWLDAKAASTAISAEQWRYYLGGIKTSVPAHQGKEQREKSAYFKNRPSSKRQNLGGTD